MEDHSGEVEVGDTYSLQGTVDVVIYNLWVMKDPTYVMRMMSASGRLLEDHACKKTVRIWKENG